MVRQNPTTKNKQYRLSLIENSTHKTIRTIRFSGPFFIIAASATVVAVILLIYCAIAFTPLRKSIPGYPDAHSKKVALENAIKIDSLENAISRWNLYVTNLRQLFADEQHISPDSLLSTSSNGTRYLSSKSIGALQRQDSILRKTVIAEEQFGVGAAERQLPIEGMHFFTPTKGIISTEYDAILHPAIDISSTKGAIVSAVLDGSVVLSQSSESAGKLLIIQHNSDTISIYSNLESVLVASGESVKAGSPIARVAPTAGKADSYHLHFELWHRGQARNPSQYIKF